MSRGSSLGGRLGPYAPYPLLQDGLGVWPALPPALLRWMSADSWGYFEPVGSVEGTDRGAVTPDSRKEFPMECGKRGPGVWGGEDPGAALGVFSGRAWGQWEGAEFCCQAGTLAHLENGSGPRRPKSGQILEKQVDRVGCGRDGVGMTPGGGVSALV